MGSGGVGGVGSSSSKTGIVGFFKKNFSLKKKKKLDSDSEVSDVESSRHSNADASDRYAPFNEFNLDDANIDSMRKELKEKGFCKISMSDLTYNFLEDYKNNAYKNNAYKCYDLNYSTSTQGEAIKENVTNFAESLIEDNNLYLSTFQVRKWEKRSNPQQWHMDVGGIKLVLIATLKGKGTEYIPLDEIDKFEKDSEDFFFPKNYTSEDSIQVMDQKSFYFFVGSGNTNDDFPKLVHRAPEDDKRKILLAYWE